MSYIPNKAMRHAYARPESGSGGELGGVPDKMVERAQGLGWLIGAAGIGIVAAGVAALLSLRSSTPRTTPKRRARRAPPKPRATKPRAKKQAA